MLVVNKVEVFDHPDIAENSYALCKAIIHHLLKIFKIYMSKNLYFFWQNSIFVIFIKNVRVPRTEMSDVIHPFALPPLVRTASR